MLVPELDVADAIERRDRAAAEAKRPELEDGDGWAAVAAWKDLRCERMTPDIGLVPATRTQGEAIRALVLEARGTRPDSTPRPGGST
jgi:hypothetical protein